MRALESLCADVEERRSVCGLIELDGLEVRVEAFLVGVGWTLWNFTLTNDESACYRGGVNGQTLTPSEATLAARLLGVL
ncbi:hypothetical protein UFOVP1346_59 [uncultured Caudovirales phage]|uniref:Uncharacterized protein n=1 Tax=uncultured Caudovirales phage TaxID=2100421 RepID=A0A6J5R162_9CAUD|nr:hypothetical protein UFOVP921_39 [uncultured Caudovirales phage]CAB4187331.1 hypothetical protein UFOVP1156_15 [uncultured Caudovirales phage]CAB4200700.1 hypothetical protein UFOVP1346_59 [uncultured Caudovirales phage]